ncbi:uncharacterized protein Triagg1_4179 [Trichoderma aggressivum f. europaeum]|uniref:DUF6604 domain-containing protein n=1 Tax=Trichoderma aggressivum f. europaeum TaxID=173218 RepID=A0AAE1IEU5_9HYPO|nr:hypothetical protein Triagg1_4179 [Trichoderma aggressivum f. europaeum]
MATIARKGFADRLTSTGLKVNSLSEGRHSFFVEVLEKVRHILGPTIETIQSDSEETTKADIKPDGLAKNIFSVLEVYHTSTEFQNAPDAVPTPATEVKYVAEQEDTFMDVIFAFTALLDDYHRLRIEIKSLWADYVSGSLDLAAVSVATNVAFEMARNMEEEIDSLLSKEGGGGLVANRYFAALCTAFGIEMNAKKQPKDPYNLDAYDLADMCLMNSLTLLVSYLQSTDPSEMYLQSYNGSFGWYDETVGDSAQTRRQKWNQDMTAMLEFMPDVSFLASKLDRTTVVDEITRGMAYLANNTTQDPPFWLAWATQIYVDILQFLGPDCDCGYREMQQESLNIKHSMLDIAASSKERSKVLHAACMWDNDPIWMSRKLMSDLGLFPNAIAPPFKFLRRNPLYCGLLIHNMRSNLHSAGGPFAATPGALLGVTQLYHALRQEKLLAEDLEWEDLETLRKLQGNPSFFVGDLPTNREAYFKNYCLSIGTSVTNWAPNRRKSKLKINSANRRNLKYTGYVSLSTNHRLEHPGARQPWSPSAVEAILIEGVRKQYTDSREHFQTEFKDVVEKESLELAKLLPPGIIRKLALAIQNEIPGISFNYFTMHTEAWNLLRRLEEGFSQVLGPNVLSKNPDDLPFAAGIVLATAAGQMSPQGDKKVEKSDVLMHVAADALQQFLREGQGSVIKEASAKNVRPEDVESLKFGGSDPWGIDKLKQVYRYL